MEQLPYQFQITLEAARVNAGKTLKEAAKESRIRPDRLAAFEIDALRVTYDAARRLCLLYCVPVETIYWGKPEDCRARNRDAYKMGISKEIVEKVSQPC